MARRLGCVFLLVCLSACAKSTGKVTGTARVVKGGTGAASAAATAAAIPADGIWALSPNATRFQITRLDFQRPDGFSLASTPLEDCFVEYQYDAVSGSELLACPFEFELGDGQESGSLGGIDVHVRNEYAALVDDPLNELFSTVDGLVAVEPPGGAEFFEYVTDEAGVGEDVQYGTPSILAIDVAAGDSIVVSIVADMNHSMQALVTAGVPAFHELGRPGNLAAFPQEGGRSVLYNEVGTALNVNLESFPTGHARVRITYLNDTPMLLEAQGPGVCVTGSGEAMANLNGGYLGKDTNGTIAWAIVAETSAVGEGEYGGYSRLDERDTLAATTDLTCVSTTTVPPPTSGSTYESGAPDISAPDFTTTLTLSAN